jgi:hypothetical protein
VTVVIYLTGMKVFIYKSHLIFPYTDICVGNSLNALRARGYTIYGEQGLDLYSFNMENSKIELPILNMDITTSSFYGKFARIESINGIYDRNIPFDKIYEKLISLYGQPREITSRKNGYLMFISIDSEALINRYVFYSAGYNIVLVQCGNEPIHLSIYPSKRATEIFVPDGIFVNLLCILPQEINNSKIMLELLLSNNTIRKQYIKKLNNLNTNNIVELETQMSRKIIEQILSENTRVDSYNEIYDKLNNRKYYRISGYYELYKISYYALVSEDISRIIVNNHFLKKTRDAIHI